MKIIKMSSVGSYMMTHFLLSLAIQAQAITHTISVAVDYFTQIKKNDNWKKEKDNFTQLFIILANLIKSLLNIKINNILNC
jgi:hypothetical protein